MYILCRRGGGGVTLCPLHPQWRPFCAGNGLKKISLNFQCDDNDFLNQNEGIETLPADKLEIHNNVIIMHIKRKE